MTRKADRNPEPPPSGETAPAVATAAKSRPMKMALIGSVVLHVALLAFVATRLPAGEQPGVEPIVVYEAPAPPETPEPETARVYRGAPAEAKESPTRAETAPEAEGIPEPPEPDLRDEPRTEEIEEPDPGEALADRLLKEGIVAPGYSVTNLSADGIERLAGAGNAVIVVQCGDADYRIRGAPSRPSGVDLADARLHGRFARRGLELEGDFPEAFHEIQDSFGVSRSDLARARVRLLFSIAIDNLILGRQEEAARRAGYDGLEDVASTRGRLVYEKGGVGDYRVDVVVDRKGRIVGG